MRFVRCDHQFYVDISLCPQLLHDVGGLLKVHIAVVVPVDEKNGLSPCFYVGDRGRFTRELPLGFWHISPPL